MTPDWSNRVVCSSVRATGRYAPKRSVDETLNSSCLWNQKSLWIVSFTEERANFKEVKMGGVKKQTKKNGHWN